MPIKKEEKLPIVIAHLISEYTDTVNLALTCRAWHVTLKQKLEFTLLLRLDFNALMTAIMNQKKSNVVLELFRESQLYFVECLQKISADKLHIIGGLHGNIAATMLNDEKISKQLGDTQEEKETPVINIEAFPFAEAANYDAIVTNNLVKSGYYRQSLLAKANKQRLAIQAPVITQDVIPSGLGM